MRHRFSDGSLVGLVSSQVAVNAGHFIALPVLVIFWAERPGISVEDAGLALGILLGVARLGPLLTGRIADRLGHWNAIRIGLALRALGLGAVPIADSPMSAFLAATTLGMGIAFHEPGLYGALGKAPAAERERLLLRHVQALNLGCVLGPALSILIGLSPQVAFTSAAGVTGVVAAWSFFENGTKSSTNALSPERSGSGVDVRFIAFALALVPFWALFAQLFAALPVLMARAGQDAAWASSVILLNGIIGFLAVPLMMSVLGRYGLRSMVAAGSALAACSVAALGLPIGLAGLLLLIVALSVAETAVTTAMDVITARYADGQDVASHFGMLKVGAGIGTSLGAPIGVIASEHGQFGLFLLGMLGIGSCLAPLSLAKERISNKAHGDGQPEEGEQPGAAWTYPDPDPNRG